MSDWQLGIDFGTSFTVVAVAKEGRPEVIDVESDGRSRLPSAVFLTEDQEVLVGTRALHQAVFAPDRFEPTPKRSIGQGQVFLGDGLIDVSDLVAGVFRRVYRETCRQQGGTAPSAVRITHPAGWADKRLDVLKRAVAAAGIENAQFVAEPIAAAARIAMAATQPGQSIAVYDFGGGTFDAAVLRRTPDGFEVAGPPTGRDPLGGEDIDRRIFDHIGTLLSEDHPDEWKQLTVPSDVVWRRHAASLRQEIRQAKETLSEVTACQLWVAGIETGVQLTRSEFEELIRDDIDATVASLAEAISAAGTTPKELAGVYLVGGSSRIPLVADAIWRGLDVVPTAQENPKSVVAMGAAAWLSSPGGAGAPAAETSGGGSLTGQSETEGGDRTDDEAGGTWRTRLALMTGGAADAGMRPDLLRCSGSVIVDVPGRGRITVQIWPAPPTATPRQFADNLANQYRASDPSFAEVALEPSGVLGQADGLTRRYWARGNAGPEQRVDGYAVVGGYSVLAVAPAGLEEELRCLRAASPVLDPSTFFAPVVEYTGSATSVFERVQMQVAGTARQVTASRLPAGSPVSAWIDHQVSQLVAANPGSMGSSRAAGAVLGDILGEVVTVRVPRQPPLLAAVGAGASEGSLYEVTVWLAEHERPILPWLAHRPLIQPLP